MVQILQIALSLLDVVERLGVNVAQLAQAREKAKAEGRDLTDEELQPFADQAQSAIDRAKSA